MSIRRGDVDYVEHKTWTCKMTSTPQNFVEGSSSTKKEDKRNKTGVNFGLSFPLNMPGIAYLKPWKIEQYYQHDLKKLIYWYSSFSWKSLSWLSHMAGHVSSKCWDHPLWKSFH